MPGSSGIRAEAAYLPPSQHADVAHQAVLHEVGEEALRELQGSHRIAIWDTISVAGLPAFEVTLRHELEHARQWEECGPRWSDANQALLERCSDDSYYVMPAERAANAAAAAFVERRQPGSLEHLAAHERLRQYGDIGDPASFDDLPQLTVDALRTLLDSDSDKPLVDELDALLVGANRWRSDRAKGLFVSPRTVPPEKRVVLLR